MNRPFFTEALPCEQCGEPTSKPRKWNPDRQVWIAQDCPCSQPANRPSVIRQIGKARSVRQVRKIMSQERKEAA